MVDNVQAKCGEAAGKSECGQRFFLFAQPGSHGRTRQSMRMCRTQQHGWCLCIRGNTETTTRQAALLRMAQQVSFDDQNDVYTDGVESVG